MCAQSPCSPINEFVCSFKFARFSRETLLKVCKRKKPASLLWEVTKKNWDNENSFHFQHPKGFFFVIINSSFEMFIKVMTGENRVCSVLTIVNCLQYTFTFNTGEFTETLSRFLLSVL